MFKAGRMFVAAKLTLKKHDMSFEHQDVDVAIVGGGIMGIAMAYAALQQGLTVRLFERHPRATGATVRNFGMIWPVGQAAATFGIAMRSREAWLQLADEAGFWVSAGGSLHLAYRLEEVAVLEEFTDFAAAVGYQVEMLTPAQATARSAIVQPKGLQAALWSATEVNVDPRQATDLLHKWLINKGVQIHYQTVITHISYPYVHSGAQRWRAERIFVCSGADFETLYPTHFEQSDITKCKLQMLRTVSQPPGFNIGPNLAAGLTLQHYASFASCPSLPALKALFTAEYPAYNKWGIHVLLSQTALGELTIGDSHEYGHDLSPFDKQEINDLIISYLRQFAQLPDWRIAETWHGIYAKMPHATRYVVQPEPGVTIVNGLGGAGMTLSFGLAQEVLAATS